jgi:deazaflavin-dependent oxidoreductase (nitroreductase family)
VTDALGAARDDDFCYLTTRGRVTGRLHEIEIWFALDGSTLFVLSGGGDRSDWVRNVMAESSVSVRLGTRTWDGAARVLTPRTDEDARARRSVFDKYQARYDGDLTAWRERALPVAIDLDVSQS